LGQHSASRDARLAEAKKQAKLIGRQAAQWERPDLEETMHKLSDYAGKIVLLHFWSAEAQSSFRSMSQVNEIVDEFADKPVAALGMNAEYDLEEAQLVDGAMELKYPTLRIDEELAESYGVSTFPTFVVVDQKGFVRAFFVGCTPKVKDAIKDAIRDLLRTGTTSQIRE
jgi:thiol-disulfide isomerase/thioredoxin